MGSTDKVEKLLERAEHEGTPPAEAAACRQKVKAIRQKPRTLVVQPPTPEDLEEADLGELAVIANKFHEQAEAGIANMLDAALSAGQTLLTAKERCEHGEWGHWVEANFHGTKRTAQRYMRLASKTTRVSHLDQTLSIRAALEAITKEPEEPPSYKPKGKGGRVTPSSGQRFEKRYYEISEDINFIFHTVDTDAEFADAAREHLEGLVEQRDVLTKLIRKLDNSGTSRLPAMARGQG